MLAVMLSAVPLAESPLAVPGALLCAWLHTLQTFPRCFRTALSTNLRLALGPALCSSQNGHSRGCSKLSGLQAGCRPRSFSALWVEGAWLGAAGPAPSLSAVQGPREQQLCSVALVLCWRGGRSFRRGHSNLSSARWDTGRSCVWIPCPAMPWAGSPHIPTTAAWAELWFPACLCDQFCPDDLITGLPWTGHCLVFLHTMSWPRYAAPWGMQSICFLFFFPVISCLPFSSFICVFLSGPFVPHQGFWLPVPQVCCAGAGCVFG